MSCRDCVLSRREFVSASTLAAVAAVLAACGGGGDPTSPTGNGGPNVPPVTGPITVRIADFPQLSQNLTPVAINASVAVVRIAPGNFVAFSRSCTHEGTQVAVNDDGFTCPNHGSAFRADGSVLTGPATAPLRRLTVAFDATAGVLTITP